jgi:hypothetical protein
MTAPKQLVKKLKSMMNYIGFKRMQLEKNLVNMEIYIMKKF